MGTGIGMEMGTGVGGYVYIFSYLHTQFKKSGITHTRTQLMWEFLVKIGTDSDNTHGDGFIWCIITFYQIY